MQYMNLKQFSHLFFDFDGLLVDTEPLHFRVWKQLCIKKNLSFNLTFREYTILAHAVKSSFYPFLKQANNLSDKKIQALKIEKHKTYLELLKESPPSWMPGAEEFLKQAHQKKHTLTVVTNAHQSEVSIIKQHLETLTLIKHWITSDCYEERKPHPEPYLTAYSRFPSIKKNAIFCFEDTLKGAASFDKADLSGVIINSTLHPNKTDLDLVESFSQLRL